MEKPETVARSRPLKVAWFFVSLGYWLSWLAAGLLLVLVITMWTTDFTPKYARLPVEVSLHENSDGEIMEPIAADGSLTIAGFGYLKVRADELPGLRYIMIMPMILLAGLIWLLFLLRRLLRNVRRGSPFDPQNPVFLKKIGWLLTIGGPVYGIFNYIYARIYIGLVDIPNAYLSPAKDIQGVIIIAGLIIVVISQVYDEAVKIKTEADLTI